MNRRLLNNPYQTDLFKCTGLAKINGCLCIAEFDILPSGEVGRCPKCNSTEFREAPYGWVECCGDGCDFAVDKNVLKSGRQ